MNSSIGELSASIARNTALVEEYLHSHSRPLPSFASDGPIDLQLPEEVDKARIAAIDATQELNDLLRGPIALVRPVVSSPSVPMKPTADILQLNGTSLQAIYRYDIATKVPLTGKIAFAELSQSCGLQEVDVRRILRFAMSWHRCFCEPELGFVAHTAASRKLAEDSLMRDGLGLMFDECWPSYARVRRLSLGHYSRRLTKQIDRPSTPYRFTIVRNPIRQSVFSQSRKNDAEAKPARDILWPMRPTTRYMTI